MAPTPSSTDPAHGAGRCDLLENPTHFINRELSWLEFNRHVLSEASDPSHPLLERVKFVAIFAGNLDEFFMIRVSGLQRQLAKGVRELPPDGMTPSRQLEAIHRVLHPVLAELSCLWHDRIVPALAEEGIRVIRYPDVSPAGQEALRGYFTREIFPVLTPLTFDTSHPFPFISNLSLNLAVMLRDPQTRRDSFARVKVPAGLFPRLVPVPGEAAGSGMQDKRTLLFLEDLVSANLDLLFPGLEVVASYPFRVTRDADLEIEEDEASDLLTLVEESVEQRRIGRPCRIEVTPDMPEQFLLLLGKKLGIPPALFYRVTGPVGMADLMVLRDLDRPDLKDAPFVPVIPPGLSGGPEIFASIRQRDRLVYHPYDSFAPVVTFLREAARDPDVLAIKATLYRVGPDSPVVAALREAREQGKDVTVLVELKARFDEENNIGWARALEHAGVHVVYGVVGLKVHAKVCMVVRREKGGPVRYIHLGTGNYNPTTARIYTDLGMFTADPAIGADVADLFNTLTGGSKVTDYKKLLVAPASIRSGIVRRIEGEIERHRSAGDGYLVFKMNALVDRDCILALYRASQAGVRIELQVRGICCLRPGVPGLSEHIRVTSIVGRFLEHARVYYFHNGGEPEIFLGSADLMPRNLDRRVEVLFPVEDERLRSVIADTILPVQLADTEKTRELLPSGTYRRTSPAPGTGAVNAQAWFMEHAGGWHWEQPANRDKDPA